MRLAFIIDVSARSNVDTNGFDAVNTAVCLADASSDANYFLPGR